jgi:SpoVK/Ycf46/Vps4 family AAA+-type ATPase
MSEGSVPFTEIKTFDDLVKLAYNYPDMKEDNEDIAELYHIRRHLSKLKKMVGLEELKQQLVYQIMYCIQDFHNDEMMHTALMGPPGVGKTTVAHILADIYKALGFITKGKLIVVGREDLVGQFLGETALKTRHVLESSIGNVLFIDEAYSLGNTGSGDSFSKECIDTITKFIGENTKNFICIIAGYKKELKECFFDNNPGLDRRFPWKYTLTSYKPTEFVEIYTGMITKKGWRLAASKKTKEELKTLFDKYKDYFANNGGDIQNFINTCKMAHGRRVFGGGRKAFKKYINIYDIKKGFEIYKLSKKNIDQSKRLTMLSMYT